MTLPPVDLATEVTALAGRPVATAGTGPDGRPTVVLVEVGRPRRGYVRARLSDLAVRDPMPVALSVRVPCGATLGDLVLAHADTRADGAVALTRIRWPQTASVGIDWRLTAGTGALLVGALALQNLVALTIAASFFVWTMSRMLLALRSEGSAVPARAFDGKRELMLSTLLALTRPQLGRTGPTPAQRVTLVTQDYAALRADVAYRIENSALFDGAFPETRRFEVALVAWDPTSPDAEGLAAEVEDSFRAARAAAEDLGLQHLPEPARATARRAQGAVATALAAGSVAEREAAAAVAAGLLRSLALYYLPSVDPQAPRLLGASRKIEPGR